MKTFEEAIEFVATMRDRDRVVEAFVQEARESVYVVTMLNSLCQNMVELVGRDTNDADLVYGVVQSGMFTAMMHGLAVGREMERQDRLPECIIGGESEVGRPEGPSH